MSSFNITQRLSPNMTKGRQGQIPDHFCLHTSGGTFTSAVNTVLNPASQVSYHFLISKAGEIVQFVNIENWAWANGTNNSGGNLDNSRSTLELVRQRRLNANWYTVSISCGDMPAGNPSKEQLNACAWLIRHINRELQRIYGVQIPLRRDRVVGHGEITPVTRSGCPGRAFPFDELIRLANNESSPSTPAPPTQSSTQHTSPAADTALAFKVGDTVQFTGGGVYVSSNASVPAHSRGKSQCRVTHTANARNPYHLVSTDNTRVHGWVVAGDVQAIQSSSNSASVIRVGSRVRLNPGAKTFTGGNISAFVFSDTWIVLQINGDRVVINNNISGTNAIMTPVNIRDLTLA